VIGAVPVHVPVELVSVWRWREIPDSAGHAVFAGAAAVTTALNALRWDAEPAPLVAVTREYTFEPASAPDSTYDDRFAFAIVTQLFPFTSQRRHAYENAIGAVPVHVPLPVVSV